VRKPKRKITVFIEEEDYAKLETLANARRLKPCQLARQYIVGELQIDYKVCVERGQALNNPILPHYKPVE
jgi:hypothetical protein